MMGIVTILFENKINRIRRARTYTRKYTNTGSKFVDPGIERDLVNGLTINEFPLWIVRASFPPDTITPAPVFARSAV